MTLKKKNEEAFVQLINLFDGLVTIANNTDLVMPTRSIAMAACEAIGLQVDAVIGQQKALSTKQ